MYHQDWRVHLASLLNGFPANESGTAEPYAAVMLNHAFDSPKLKFTLEESSLENAKIRQFAALWNNATIRHAVDGGSNTLYDLQQLAKGHDAQLKEPHLLTGDMNSIRGEILQHYRNVPGVDVVETPDQDYTDFTKAIQVLSRQKNLIAYEVQSIVVFFTSSGRLDHLLSVYNTLYKFDKPMERCVLPPIILVDLADSVSFLLTKGKHLIPSVKSANWCSLVPLQGPVTLTTTGFRWNLNEDTLEFGKFISTSQEFDGKSDQAMVDIASDKAILFSFNYQ